MIILRIHLEKAKMELDRFIKDLFVMPLPKIQ